MFKFTLVLLAVTVASVVCNAEARNRSKNEFQPCTATQSKIAETRRKWVNFLHEYDFDKLSDYDFLQMHSRISDNRIVSLASIDELINKKDPSAASIVDSIIEYNRDSPNTERILKDMAKQGCLRPETIRKYLPYYKA